MSFQSGSTTVQAPSKTFQADGFFYHEPLVNHGIYASVKAQVIGGKGTKTQSSSTTQQSPLQLKTRAKMEHLEVYS